MQAMISPTKAWPWHEKGVDKESLFGTPILLMIYQVDPRSLILMQHYEELNIDFFFYVPYLSTI